MNFKAAKCPNCAGDIQVPDDRDNVKCMYCSCDIVVKEVIQSAVGGVNVENLLYLAEQAEKSNYSTNKYDLSCAEAYNLYSRILEHDRKNVNAIVGQAITNPQFGGISRAQDKQIDLLTEYAQSTNIGTNVIRLLKERIRALYNGDFELYSRQLFFIFFAIRRADREDEYGLFCQALFNASDDRKQTERLKKFVHFYRKALEKSNWDTFLKNFIIRKNDPSKSTNNTLLLMKTYLNMHGIFLNISHYSSYFMK